MRLPRALHCFLDPQIGPNMGKFSRYFFRIFLCPLCVLFLHFLSPSSALIGRLISVSVDYIPSKWGRHFSLHLHTCLVTLLLLLKNLSYYVVATLIVATLNPDFPIFLPKDSCYYSLFL